MAAKLKQLRETLETLQSYKLPIQFEPPDSSETNKNNTENTIDKDLILRYEKAKSKYLQQRITELLIEHVETFDGTSFQFPPLPDTSIIEKNKNDEDHICKKVKRSTNNLAENLNLLHADYENFRERINELQRMVKDIESKHESFGDKSGEDYDASEETGGDIDDVKLAEQEEKLAGLVRKRMTLQSKLKRLKEEKDAIEQKQSNLSMQWNGEKENHPMYASCTVNETLESMKQDKEEMKLSISKLKEKMTWYKSVTEAFEELGGIKILSVENADGNKLSNENRSYKSNANEMIVKFVLLEKYFLEVTLSPMTKNNKPIRTHSENLIISHAILHHLRDKDGTNTSDQIKSEDHTVMLPIPTIIDILPITQTFSHKSAENLRFLLRETLLRLRATESRAEELSLLRRKYLTKILKSGQEIVCSLNEGVTVVIRLTPDCPIVMGSAYVEEIVGIGGWSEEDLENLKIKVNRKINSGDTSWKDDKTSELIGPIVSIMDMLVKELRSMRKPGTPKLPLTNKK